MRLLRSRKSKIEPSKDSDLRSSNGMATEGYLKSLAIHTWLCVTLATKIVWDSVNKSRMSHPSFLTLLNGGLSDSIWFWIGSQLVQLFNLSKDETCMKTGTLQLILLKSEASLVELGPSVTGCPLHLNKLHGSVKDRSIQSVSDGGARTTATTFWECGKLGDSCSDPYEKFVREALIGDENCMGNCTGDFGRKSRWKICMGNLGSRFPWEISRTSLPYKARRQLRAVKRHTCTAANLLHHLWFEACFVGWCDSLHDCHKDSKYKSAETSFIFSKTCS